MIVIACGNETGAAGGDCRSGGAIMCTRRILGLAVVALLTFGGRARAYTNQWAAHIEGGEEVAKQVAEDYGFRYLGKVSVSFLFDGTTQEFFSSSLSMCRFSKSCAIFSIHMVTERASTTSAITLFIWHEVSADLIAFDNLE